MKEKWGRVGKSQPKSESDSGQNFETHTLPEFSQPTAKPNPDIRGLDTRLYPTQCHPYAQV